MRNRAITIALGLLLGLAARDADAQQPITSGAEPLKASVSANPLRFGTDQAYIAFAPFFQFEAGHIWSSPDELTDALDDKTDGQMRRARLYADFGYYDFGGRFTIDFATDPNPDIIYAYLDYNFDKSTTLQVGQQDQQFSQQSLIGSRSALFNENGVNATLQPPSAVGAAVFHGQKNYSLGGGVYGTDINDDPFDQSVTVAARGTYAPVNDGDTAIHLGLSLAGTFDSDAPRSFSGSNGTNLFSLSPISTGAFNDIESYLASNFEFAATVGRFTLQSEYTLGEVNDGERKDAFLHGGYLGMLAFLTEDHREYDGQYGIFKRVKPKRPVNEGSGDFGAVEIGGRLDYLDLSDANDAATDKSGVQIGGTGILNWYLNDKVRLSASDTYTTVIDGPGDGNDYNTAILRFWFVY